MGTKSQYHTHFQHNPYQWLSPLLLCCLVLFSAIIYAQRPNPQSYQQPLTFHYKLLTEAPIFECDITGRILSRKVYEAPADAVFTLIAEDPDADSVVIRFWEWERASEDKQLEYNYTDSSKSDLRYFLLSKTYFNSPRVVPRYTMKASFTAGTVVIPVKIRSRPFDFSTDVTLGPTAGVRWGISPYTNTNFFSAMLGFGVTHITLDSLSTQGVIDQTADRPALTLSLGGVFEFSNAQVGLFVGWDQISRNQEQRWIYQGKPWFSIGLGYAIISRNGDQVAGKAGKNEQ